MTNPLTVDICVIGAGSAGLSVAAGAAQLGARTVLIEAHKMGGDCLNYGCVPSKALLAAAHAAESARQAHRFGVSLPPPSVDFRRVHEHVHGVIAAIAPHDSVERFEGLGVQVIRAAARFTDANEVAAGDHRIRARRFVVATGSRPAIPPIPGLDRAPFLTNETVFDLTALPSHLLVVGGGPIGCELAQAFRRLGSSVTLVEMATILAKDDPELVAIVRRQLTAEGITLLEAATVVAVAMANDEVTLHVEANGQSHAIAGSHLLIAAGRQPKVDELGLDKAGVAVAKAGIAVDRRLRTTNRRIFAIGDVAGGPQFTHVAGYHAGIVIRNALFRLPARVNHDAVPWVTYTGPELAHVGLTETQARQRFREPRVLRHAFAGNDRAQAERLTEGLIKVVAGPGGRILGASIAGPHAGELIHSWVLAIGNKLKLGAIANMIAPYPTLGEVNKRAAGAYYTPMLFSDRTRRLVRLLRLFG